MPILKEKVAVYPDNLLQDDWPQNDESKWLVIYAKSRQEKALARQLRAYDVPYYLPLTPKENLIRGRRVVSQIPLFGGYMFLYATDAQRSAALTTNRICEVIEVYDGEQLRHDLCQIQGLIDAGVGLTVERRLKPGRRVRVKSGPFAGTEGVVLERRGSNRLLVAVRLLQQGVSLKIDDYLVEPIY